MSSTLEAYVFMGKNYSENLLSIKNTGNDLTLKQMFDISEKLIVGQSDEIFGVTPISWEDSSWKQLSLVNDEEVISLSHAKVYVFSDSVLCLGKVNQNSTSNSAWEEKLSWFKSSSQSRNLDTNDGEPMELERNIFPGFTTLQLINKVQEFMTKVGDPSQFKGRIIFMSMFNDIIMVIWTQWTGWMQDSWMLLKSDSISWQKILQNSHNSQTQWPVVSTLCQETKEHLNQKVGSEGTPKLGPYWKLQLVVCTVKRSWGQNYGL